jgi:hypothetical protein
MELDVKQNVVYNLKICMTDSWVSHTIAAIVVHSSSDDQLDSDILLPETNEYETYYFD